MTDAARQVNNMPQIGGSFNVAPPGFREMTADEFAKSLPPWCVVATEHRQLWSDVEGNRLPRMISGTLHLFSDETGFMIEQHYDKGRYELKYYRFGCKHALKEISIAEAKRRNILHYGNCYHVYECTKCGYVQGVDTSD